MTDHHIMRHLASTFWFFAVLETGMDPALLPSSTVRQISSDRSSRVALLHTISVPAHPIALAIDAAIGRVVVLSQGPGDSNNYGEPTGHASVSFLDAATGRLVRTVSLGPSSYVGDPVYGSNFSPSSHQSGIQSLAIDEAAGRVFVLQVGKPTPGTQSSATPITGQIRILDALTGRILRTVPAGQNPLMLVADAHSGHLFVPDARPGISIYDHRRGSIRMFSTASGALVRAIPVDPDVYVSAVGVDARRGHVLFQGAPKPGEDGVVVIDARTGRVVRVVALATSLNACSPSLVFDEGTNHFIEASGEARASMRAQVLDGNTGRVLRDEMLPSMADAGGSCPVALAADASTARAFVYEAPAYTGGMSYVSVLDTRDGRIVSTVPTGFGESTSISLAIDHRAGSTFIVDTNTPDVTTTVNKLTVLDTRSGRVLHTMTLGQGPPVVAVDERTELLFVVNGADNTVSVFDISRL